jgi:hypothetical protein
LVNRVLSMAVYQSLFGGDLSATKRWTASPSGTMRIDDTPHGACPSEGHKRIIIVNLYSGQCPSVRGQIKK